MRSADAAPSDAIIDRLEELKGQYQRVADIDEVLAFRPEYGGTAGVAEVCARMRACIDRRSSPGSIYRKMADDVRTSTDRKYNHEDVRLRAVMTTLRHDLANGNIVSTPTSNETAWLASLGSTTTIQLDKLPVIALGDVRSLQVGDPVLAIGNPFNVGQTVTSGIVSALGRDQLGINLFENFIQTDAAINPGNSGGALVDTRGNLVGINTAIYSRSGGSLGIGFAIPVNTARQVMEGLVRDGQVTRGWIGVEPRELTPEIAETLRLPVRQGVLITGVLQSGPASEGGLRPGDVVTKVADKPVASTGQLLNAVAALKPRETAVISVQRGERALDLTVTVGQRPKSRARQPQ
mgnify:CR=1 FL=1